VFDVAYSVPVGNIALQNSLYRNNES
jgi:hypothetical protein